VRLAREARAEASKAPATLKSATSLIVNSERGANLKISGTNWY
jgi:hypothetical protein